MKDGAEIDKGTLQERPPGCDWVLVMTRAGLIAAEETASYLAHFTPENGILSLNNTPLPKDS